MEQYSSRITQYHEDGSLWQYMLKDEQCGCGCNVFHHEYDKALNKIFIICNACDAEVAEYREEYTQEELSRGVWK